MSCLVCQSSCRSPLRENGPPPPRWVASECRGGLREGYTVTTGSPASSTWLSTNCSRHWWRSLGRTFWTRASQIGRQSIAHKTKGTYLATQSLPVISLLKQSLSYCDSYVQFSSSICTVQNASEEVVLSTKYRQLVTLTWIHFF